MLIGLVGKPSCGKSTFFKAATLAEVEIASYPFTTIKANHGVAYVKIDCIDKEFDVQCNPSHGFCINHQRFVPIELMDVAGLVPGASEGKGLGNQFLDELRQADVFVHIVDVSGETDVEGKPTKDYDVCKDVLFLEEELNISLKRVGVDHFDLYQFHAVTEMEEVERIFAPKGAVETFVKAQKEGKIRFIGFSAHSEEAALALLDRFEFNSALFPINFVSYAQGNFGPRVVEKAKEKGASRLALKVLAHTPIPDEVEKKYPKCWYKPVDEESLAEKALRFTLSQDITAAIPPGDEKLYKMALTLAQRYHPMDDGEISMLMEQNKSMEPLFPLS